jgi:mRNA-degrading endonuclease RelE of RelBE toxin-antitoxin system
MNKNIEIQYLKKANKFLAKNFNVITKNDVDALIIKAIRKIFKNEDINIDLKSMSTMESYYRIRKGNIRIIFYIDENDELIVSVVETIGYRGDIYKK